MLSYDIHSFARMIRDRVRTDAYAEALHSCVGLDSVVLDMGTGVGIWALLACQFGARKVYAVDPNQAIQVAREIAAANGYSDRIEFIEDLSTKITLPEPANIIVTEMHGILPMFEQNIASIIDARQRLLAPGGRIIPQRESLWAVPVEAPESFEEVRSPWSNRPYGIDMQPALRIASNSWFKSNLRPDAILCDPGCWAALDYRSIESPNVAGKVNMTATRAGTGHGVAIWFDTVLVDGIGFSNAPGAAETIFGQAFFPWPEAVAIAPGDRISLALRADLVRDYHLWRWDTTVWDQKDPERERVNFKQSTFFDLPISTEVLHKRADDYLPRLSEEGQVKQLVYSLMDGKHSLGKISSLAAAQFPELFASYDDAKTTVADISEKYSK
jgi:protein arginine N-methyltransferase 1